jgi:uncharacterized BrkB/YihY/UPF0761 family membrane protein
MSIIWKIIGIFYIFGLIAALMLGRIGPYGDIILLFLFAFVPGFLLIFEFPHIAIPYYIVAFSLLYWWEKRKRKTKVEENVV